ncbi:MAG: hypothetical protein QM772_04835 [Ottowia sp.]|uniref:hypothetical protein n=1 Tax=Ottowia sp. TaxID=1898956 RepID=UPI0039E62CFD
MSRTDPFKGAEGQTFAPMSSMPCEAGRHHNTRQTQKCAAGLDHSISFLRPTEPAVAQVA